MRRNLTAVTLTCLLAGGTTAWADPVQVSSGIVSGSVSSVTDFRIEADGRVIVGIIGTAEPSEPHFQCGGGCPVGSSVDLGTEYDRIDTVEVNGVAYGGATGFFRFDSESIQVPDLGVSGRLTVSRPFTFEGTLADLGTLGTLDLTGRGHVFAFFSNQGTDGVAITRTDYVFTDQTPVPEPATLLLVGSGLAAAWSRSRARRTLSRLP